MNENEEIWKDIEEYEGLYQVSSLGIVKNSKGRILKQGKSNKGYLKVNLCKEGKKKTFNIHRLVAQTFIPNPHNYPCVNHKDENPANNNVKNLEWCTVKYNNTYGTAIERRSKKLLNREDQSKSVLQFTKDGEFVREWSSTAECERNGFDHSAVAKCCNGKLINYKGFIWKYKNKNGEH